MQRSRRNFYCQCFGIGFYVVIILLIKLRTIFCDPQLSEPTIGSDQLIYACANKEVLAFQGNGTIAWRAGMNQTCQTRVAPVIDYDGRVYVAADRTVVVITPPSSTATNASAADFFSTVPTESLKAIGNFSSVTGLAVTLWSSVLYVNTGTGLHAFMFDGTPLWSTIVQFNNSAMTSPQSMGPCAYNTTNCTLLPYLAVDQCDGSIYVARKDGWLFSYSTWQPFMRWRYALSVDVPLSVKIMAGNNGRIYAAIAEYDTVYALSSSLGTLVWQVKVGPLSEASCIPTVDLLGFVSVGSLDGFIYVISPDGILVDKYLAADSLSLVSILVAPILDCSKQAIYVSQTKVQSKIITKEADGTKGLGITEFLGMNIYLFRPSSGQVLWHTLYPDLSTKSFCDTDWNVYNKSCSQFLFTVSKMQHPGNNKALLVLVVTVMVVFFLLSLLSILMYCCWKRKLTIHGQRLCQLWKQERFQHPQGLLLRRRKIYQQNIEQLQEELETKPRSSKILDQLRVSLEGLQYIERYLALLPSETLQDDHDQFHQSRLSVEDTVGISIPVQARKGSFWRSWIDSASCTLFGAPEDEDFTEELHILSQYDNAQFSTALCPSVSRQMNPQRQLQSLDSQRLTRSGSILSDCDSKRQYSIIVPGGEVSEEYSNPLYKQSPQPLPVKPSVKIVSFSSVNEVFGEKSDSLGHTSDA
ncbi:hypothetical protein KP509_35G054900 [Ceratopteris richardii]|uniref:Protein GAMETE EXPRESSED 3 n=3 Tax=Ceratopteris richardii TaxID=49495 RepID=A0A8T2QH77_CERRI|nr:hypothetical protein KP509_35G054900 [Ceratopteris richardii]